MVGDALAGVLHLVGGTKNVSKPKVAKSLSVRFKGVLHLVKQL